MRWLLTLLLFFPTAAMADPWILLVGGDMQERVRCDGHVDAWTYASSMATWAASQSDSIKFAIFPGDVVDGASTLFGNDCYCGSIDEADDGVCQTYTNPAGDSCGAAAGRPCNLATAETCTGGTAGWYCEWTRVRALVDTIGASIPYWVGSGNHDTDSDPAGSIGCEFEMHDFNTYFGVGQFSSAHGGYIETTVACPAAADGLSTQAPSSYQIFTAGGAQYLHIGLQWYSIESTEDPVNARVPDSVIAWAKTVMDASPGMPTIVSSHEVLRDDNCAEAAYDNAWCSSLFNTTWAGYKIFDDLLKNYPQIFLTVGGHIRNQYHQVTTLPAGVKVLGAAVDFTNPNDDGYNMTGCDDTCETNSAAAGVVTLLRIDPDNNKISATSYSAELDERYEYFNADGTGAHWWANLPLCSDNNRFNWPPGACADPPVSPECCNP